MTDHDDRWSLSVHTPPAHVGGVWLAVLAGSTACDGPGRCQHSLIRDFSITHDGAAFIELDYRR